MSHRKAADSVFNVKIGCHCVRCYVERFGAEKILARVRRNAEVQEGGCWLWRGAITSRGYPSFVVARKGFGVQRFLWNLLHPGDPVIGNEVVVRNTCNDKTCVNPDHLGVIHRRELTSKHARRKRKIPDEVVRTIKGYQGSGLTTGQVERLTGINRSQVFNIWKGRIYADIN